ncbi:hypothetical protein BU16DRAFT_533676 [Lophium mytilinum]|uniref:Uncharacterized protein n=1 Tax=Lophium mytilinum TaxID=390894 RepID=A0A6A6R968_9PEZI|nr:hypothetical protein BU16DRAFT_533676 [Lophium mytilinum]
MASGSTKPLNQRKGKGKETDNLFLAMKGILGRERRRSLQAFVAGIDVRKVAKDEVARLPTKRKEDGDNAGWYTITERLEPGFLTRTHLVRWDSGTVFKARFNVERDRYITATRIEIKIRGEWMRFVDWLSELPFQKEEFLGSAAIQSNYDGGQATARNLSGSWSFQKSFVCVSTSRRMTDKDYPDALTLGNEFRPWDQVRPGCVVSDWEGYIKDSKKDVVEGPNYALMRSCKQIFAESHQIAWESSRLNFKSLSLADRCLPRIQNTVSYNTLSHVCLSFKASEYLHFFSMVSLETQHNARVAAPAGALLSKNNLPNLKSLGFNFLRPYEALRIEPWQNWDDSGPHACQKVMSDWILAHAKEFVEHIPRVYIEGYIKTSVKNKWEGIFKAQQTGNHVDLSNELLAIRAALMSDRPPFCVCTTNCRRNGCGRHVFDYED